MKLFKVTAEYEFVMAVEDDEDEYSAAEEAWRDARYDGEPSLFVGKEVKSLADLPEGWDGLCIPYLGDGNTRLQELLK